MTRMLFVNLPVQDLARSVAFFTGLGFRFNEQFTDEKATCMVVSDAACVMLLVRPFFATFTSKEVADAPRAPRRSWRSRPTAGRRWTPSSTRRWPRARSPSQQPSDEGYMYGRSFHDLDGHAWEVMWMDPESIG